jgi:hypothetical protein
MTRTRRVKSRGSMFIGAVARSTGRRRLAQMLLKSVLPAPIVRRLQDLRWPATPALYQRGQRVFDAVDLMKAIVGDGEELAASQAP